MDRTMVLILFSAKRRSAWAWWWGCVGVVSAV